MVDLRLHGGGQTNFKPLTIPEMAQVVAATQQEFTHFAPPTSEFAVDCPSSLTHLIGYGAMYYSYPWAQVFSRATWQALFARDPLSREGGERLRRSILEHGCSRPPATMLVDLLGHTPNPLEADVTF